MAEGGANWNDPPPASQLFCLCRPHVPKSDLLIAPASDDPRVMGEASVQNAVFMSGPSGNLATFFHFPNSNGTVLAGGKQHVGIIAPANGSNGGSMTGQGVEFLSAVGFPNRPGRRCDRPWPTKRYPGLYWMAVTQSVCFLRSCKHFGVAGGKYFSHACRAAQTRGRLDPNSVPRPEQYQTHFRRA